MTRFFALLTVFTAAIANTPARADEGPGFNLGDILNIKVVTATKKEQSISEAPAIMSVVTAEDIRAWGYRSVGEALAGVPGLYGVHDFVSYNYGIRGVNGGQRAYSRIAKVMINGQPVGFRSDTANYLGPELIPMEAVERIEVVLGPSSALYGANAFLGVINILTRSGATDKLGTALARFGALPGQKGLGGEVVFNPAGASWDAVAAASRVRFDRSGYELPASSPKAADHAGDATSRNDLNRSGSVVGNFRYKLSERVSLEALAQYSHLDAYGEFLDFGALSHQNRVAQDNGVGRLKADWQLSERLSANASFAFAGGRPASAEKLSIDSSTARPQRDYGYLGYDLVSEARYALSGRDSIAAGLDYTDDNQMLMNVYSIPLDANGRDAGARVNVGLDQGRRHFRNAGAYAQYISYPFATRPDLGLTANARVDRHNIYGTDFNYRVGVVDQAWAGINVKLLAGSSFKAPAALQLYAQPLYSGEIVGNAALKPETATSVEAQVSSRLTDSVSLSANVFWTRVRNKVELMALGTNTQPRNSATESPVGGEGEARWIEGRHKLTLGVQWQKTSVRTSDDFDQVSVPSDLYPEFIGGAAYLYRLPGYGHLGVNGRYVSARRATNSNILENRSRAYQLDAYYLAGLVYGYDWRRFRALLRINNLFGRRYAEPGFAGIDVPGRKRELLLTIACSF